MVDFRYHLVSLMAVLIALTVGVVLGAGPLQGKLSSTLNDRVAQLSERQTELTKESERLKDAVNNRNVYINGLADAQLPGVLSDTKVAVVTTFNVDEEDVKQTVGYLKKASAQIVSEVTLSDNWFAPDKESLRGEVVAQMNDYFDTAPEKDATTTQKLTQGLYQVLHAPSDNSTHISGLMSAKTNPLINVTTPAKEAANAVVIIFPRHTTDDDVSTTSDTKRLAVESVTDVASAAAATEVPTVIVGEAKTDTDELSVIRNASIGVTTVDSVGRVMALVSTPFALKQAIGGEVGSYGFEQGAQKKMPPFIVEKKE